jgi:hypothetical protein
MPLLWVNCAGACTVKVACRLPGDAALDLANGHGVVVASVALTAAGSGVAAFTETCPYMVPLIYNCTGACLAKTWITEEGAAD